MPFVADESATKPGEVTRELLSGAANAVSIKTARTGFSHSQRVLFQCDGLGVEVVMGNQIDGQIGTLCTVTFGAAFESTTRRAGELSNFLDMSDDLLAEPLEIVDGRLPSARSRASAWTSTRRSSAKYRLTKSTEPESTSNKPTPPRCTEPHAKVSRR